MPAIYTWSDILKLNALDETALLKTKETQRRLSLWDDLLSTLETERKHYEADAVHAIVLDFEIAKLYETELNSTEQAIELYDSVLLRMPSHTEALIALEQMLGGQNRYESALVLEKHYQRENAYADLIRILDVQLTQIDDSEDKANLYKRQAKLYQEQLNDPRSAYDCFFKALQEYLEDEDSLKSLQGIAGQLGLYAELSDAYDLLAQKDPGSEISTSLYRKRAKLCESKLAQITQAIASWEKVLEVESTDAEALSALTALYEQNQQLDQLCDVLSVRVEETPKDLDLKVKYGRLLDSVKGQLTSAIEQWRDVLQADAHHEGARSSLEAKIATGIELEEIADILQPIYENQKQFASLVRLLEAKLQFGLVQDSYQQEEIYATIAKLYHHELQNEEFAFEAYLNAFNLNPTHAEVREAFLSLGEKLAERPRVMEALELALGSMGDPDLCEADHLRLAVWYEEMGERYQAIKHYQELLKINPAHDQALTALESNFKLLENWDELALIYRARIESLDDESAQIKYWHTLAQLQTTKLYQDQAAIQSYDQILSMDESDLRAYQALAQIYLSLGQVKQLLDLYERQIESKTNLSADQKVEILLRAGELAFSGQDRQRSANFYQKALELDAKQSVAIEQLQVLYFQLADWDSLKEIKDQALKLAVEAQDESGALALNLELAQICQDRLMQPDDALQYFQNALAIQPAHQEALQKTKSLLKYQHQYADLIKVLENYRAIAESTLGSDELIGFYLELAEAYETEGQEEPAIEVLNQIRKYDENHSKALTLLARLYENNGNLEKAAETLNLALRNASGSDSVEAWRRLGNLYLDSLNDIEQAKTAYKNAVAQSEMTDTASMDSLIRIAKEQDHQTDLLFWMDSKLPLLSGKEKAKALLELSGLKMKDDADSAVRHLEEAYQLQASDLKIADKLLEIYLKAQRFDEAEPILSRIIQELQIAKQLKAISKYAYRQGQILEGRGNITAAKEAYLQCRQSDATFVPNLIAYSRLLCKLGEWDEAQEILKGLLLQRQVSNEEKVDIFYLNGMARLNANDPKKAKEMFQRALAVDASHAPSQEEMAKLG
jgi:tetratricopeptide (TPR) repeat protein